jgi:hypothetical protein
MKEIFVQSKWNVEDFALNMGFSNSRVDGCGEITNTSVADFWESNVFRQKIGSEWKNQPGDHLTTKKAKAFESYIQRFTITFLQTEDTQIFSQRPSWHIGRI